MSFLAAEFERAGVQATTCAAYLDRQPRAEPLTLPEGSWGEGGDHRTWLNNETDWAWERLYDSEAEFWSLVHEPTTATQAPVRYVLAQACRELLLMQSSDWPFSVTTGPARDYADQRFSAHFADFKRLIHIAKLAQEHGQLDQDEQTFVAEKEQQDFLFPTLEDVLFL